MQFMQWEANVLLFIQEHMRNPVLTPILQVITRLGDKGIFWILLTIALLLFKRTRYAGLCSLMALICSVVINNEIIKHLAARTRPYELIQGLELIVPRQSDYSFPSGHSAASFASAVAVWRSGQFGKPVCIALIVLAAVISLSRLYVGVHYPTDVIFGVFSGILCGLAGAALAKFFLGKMAKRREGQGSK